ncbi:transposase [Kitasatospora sp. NPDC058263]
MKASPNAPADSQGYDGGKRVKGRKRHIATDTLGLLLVLIVTAAGVQDSAGGKHVLDTLAGQWPTVTKVWVDAGYNNAVVRHGAALAFALVLSAGALRRAERPAVPAGSGRPHSTPVLTE